MARAHQLTERQVLELRAMWRAGARRKLIASHFGLTLQNTHKIATGRSYANVTGDLPRIARCSCCGHPLMEANP